MSYDKVCNDLHDYLSFRAAKEGVPYDLSPGFFSPFLADGVTEFFGITVDNNGLLEDQESPALFEQWSKQRVIH